MAIISLIKKILKFPFKLAKWVPIIWRDEDWDWAFIMILLDFKLKNMEKCFRESDIAEDDKKTANQIKYARQLISRGADSDEWSWKKLDDDKYKYYKDQYLKSWLKNRNKHRSRRPIGFNEYNDLQMRLFTLRDKEQKIAWQRLWKFLSKTMQHWWN